MVPDTNTFVTRLLRGADDSRVGLFNQRRPDVVASASHVDCPSCSSRIRIPQKDTLPAIINCIYNPNSSSFHFH
jgi:hypothetical protein